MDYFEELGLGSEMLEAIEKLGFNRPTQIQRESIPHVMRGRDVIGESATGSGKTLAFGAGIMESVAPGQGLQALVLTPTRELAEQVKDSLRELSGGRRIKIAAVYGGVSITPQINDLKRAEVVVATPGRMLDHLERGTVDTSRVRVLVLDEADRMLDMGFIDDVERIISACPCERQTLFFSATIGGRIADLSRRYMTEPVKVSVKRYVDPSKLKQVFYEVDKNSKLSLLAHLLEHENTDLAMVFCNTRRTTDFVVKNLRANRIKAIAIHGGLSQNKRTRTIKRFNDGSVRVLVCTDVAARGLDIPDVSHVYNYEIPKDANDYVHRIGRTARAGEEGKVINLLSEEDHDSFRRIEHQHRAFNIQRLRTPSVRKIKVVRPAAGGKRRRPGPKKKPFYPRRGWR
ncbi:MAG: DEAD/DEAH box helicase [Methanobacteriota archaeon]|nr:MAG: DEAD/DEAH box helicase [Euryarchaeota archaeon]